MSKNTVWSQKIHYIVENMHVLVGLHESIILKHFLEKLTQGGEGEQQKKPHPNNNPHPNNKKPQTLTAPL